MKPISQGPFLRGLNASSQVLAQPKGTVARISNLVYTKRGALTTCDGNGIIFWRNGAVDTNDGRMLCLFMFAPAGVSPYYVALAVDNNQRLGPPHLRTAVSSGGGGLTGTIYYVITTVTGAVGPQSQGESTASNEVSVSGLSSNSVLLTWDFVPAATSYNVYRGTSPGGENVLVANVLQPSVGASVTFTDGGNSAPAGSPPTQDTTTVTVLFSFAGATTAPQSYSDTSIVARFPAIASGLIPGPLGSTSAALLPASAATASGGVNQVVTFIPQIVQFQNQLVIALGNGVAPQVYPDPTTPVNTAITGVTTNLVEDAAGAKATATTGSPHGLVVGQQVLLSGGNVAGFNGAFEVLTVPTTTTWTMRNTVVTGGTTDNSGHTFTATTIPVSSSFVAALPSWVATTVYSAGSLITATGSPDGLAHVYKAIQGGTSGSGGGPTFPSGKGAQVADNNILWQEDGLLNATGPPPPGAGHIAVYAGSVWFWDTQVDDNLTTGIDGPTALRMCDTNNIGSFNPINVAFIDKDDGAEGMGLAAFTITAAGIPPEGSLIAFKLRATYQIAGVFGAPNFAIQRVRTDMGCIAPRTIQFCPGFGVIRLTHNGFAAFDGVDDRVISEEIHPYIFQETDTDDTDIGAIDPTWSAISWASQTVTPAMYVCAAPLFGTNGGLTRLFCYDLTLKTWTIIDLPFPISCLAQVTATSTNPITLMGGFNDGVISRWQAGDAKWYTLGGGSARDVAWTFRTAELASKEANQRLYCRRLVVRGISTTSSALTVTPRLGGVALPQVTTPVPAVGDFDFFVTVDRTGLRFDVKIAGTKLVEIDDIGWHLEPRPAGVPLVAA